MKKYFVLASFNTPLILTGNNRYDKKTLVWPTKFDLDWYFYNSVSTYELAPNLKTNHL